MQDNHHHSDLRLMYTLIFLYFFVCCIIIGGSVLLYFTEKESLRNDDTNELLAIAELKAKQISEFRRERYSEANFIHRNPSFITAAKNFRDNPRLPGNKSKVDDWLSTILTNHNYESISILDTLGKVFYAAGQRDTLNNEHIKKALNCFNENKIHFGDLYLHSDSVTIHLEIFVPLILTTSDRIEKVGVVNFTINPHNGMFDLMQSWPIQSRTAEVTVVKKDGDEVLYLNELRHKKNTAMKFRLPISLKNLPAARGLLGDEGIVEGIDYRGQEVLSAVKKIPHCDWLVVAKMDTNEVFEPLTERAVLIFSLMMALLIGSGTAFLIVWRGQRMKQLKIKLHSVDAVKRLNRVYQVLSNVNQAIVKITDPEKLLNEICRIAADHGDFRLCWIGLHNSHTGLIEPAAMAGVASEYLNHITVSIDENTPAGQGPSGTAFRTGKPVVLNDIAAVFQLPPWKENTLRFSLKSMAAFPLSVSAANIGTINFYSGLANFFTHEEIILLEELSQDLSYALSNIEHQKTKKTYGEALLASELKFKTIADFTSDWEYWVGPDKKIIYMSPSSEKITGYSRDEFINDPELIQRIVHPDDRHIMETHLLESFEGDAHAGIDFRMVTKNGETRWINHVCRPVFDDKRNWLGRRASNRDITERKLAEEALIASGQFLQSVLESLSAHIAILDESGVIVSVNKKWNEFGMQNGLLAGDAGVGVNYLTVCETAQGTFAEEAMAAAQRIRNIIAGKTREDHFEYACHSPSEKRWFVAHFTSFNENGKPRVIVAHENITERVLAEEAQRQSDALLWEVMDSLPVGIAVNSVNPSVKFSYMNENFARNYRTTLKELTDENAFWDSVYEDPGFREIMKKRVLDDCASGDPKRMYWEDIPITRKGETYFITAQNLPIPDKNLTISLVWDVTERKRSEQSIRESNERFNLVARATNDAVWDWDITKNETWWNERFYSLFGFKAGADRPGIELWSSRIHPDDRGRVMEHFRDALSGISLGWSDEFRYQFSNGSYGFIFDRAYILRDDSGKAVRMIGSMIDISDLKKAENKLRESEARYRLISENSTDVIWLYDLAQQKLTYISPSVQKLRGFTPEEVLKQPLEELLTPDSLKKFYEELAAFNSGDRSHLMKTIEIDQPHKMGHVVKTEIVVTLLPEETGNTALLLGVSRDITERKKIEEQLQMQSAALMATANGIVITDPDGLIEWVNTAFTELSGYSLEEAVGKNPRDLVKSGEHDDTFYKDMWTTITSGQVWRGELVNRRKDGNFYIEEQTITPIRTVGGKITHFIGVKLDITERKKAEDQLRESEERLRLSLKAANQGLFDLNVQTGEAIVSEEYATMLGYDPETFVETNSFWIERLHPDDKDRTANEYIDYISGKKEEYRVEFRQKTRSGDWKWILSMGKIVAWTPEGKPLRMLGTHTDLDTRKKIEQALRESEVTYKAFFEDDLTGDFISTPDGNLLACNLPFARIFGYDSVEEIMQVNTHSFYPDPKVRDLLIKRLVREKRIEYYSSELVRRDGAKVYVIENLIGKFDKKGKLIEIKGYLFDDTNRRNLERQLIQAQKMESLGTLAGGIAHDFNNILAIILGHNSLIRRKFADNAYIAENAETISKATQRGAGLVKQLLTFARKSDVVLESILIQDTINEIKKFIEQTFPKTITIQTECEKELPPIVADATQIHQVLLNLCINARDAMPHGGKLSISAIRINATEIQSKASKAYSPEYIHITVSDTGTGMDEATRSRIFEPFFTTKGRDRGTGLGLATVYGIIEAHHGVIDVQSEIGKGSSFHIYFPVQQSFIEHQMAESGTEEIPGGNETILVVDDEESMKALLSAVFKEKGYTVITASDGEEALEVYKQRHEDIDIVLTDMGLPKLGGEDVVKGIKKINKDARIIVASGYFERELKSGLVKSGVKDFVQKPYLPDEILQKVREVLDQQ